ncbi:Pyrophosphatase [Trema orientale]|uniref:Pyrophosphatase n=1 Tax=Trema orientale TaxID=63057 RepID=A0A2P5EVE5_TREOI|nr:Pyrophosphatase [Trema orientale]
MASTPPFSPNPSPLFAAIDMGTNSFKLLVVRAHPNGKFFTIDHRTEPVVLGRDTTTTTTTPFAISAHAELRALEALRKFKRVLASYGIGPARTRCVATSAVREAVNKGEFSDNVREKIGLVVDVLPGVEEARFVYLGMLQFFPLYDKLALCVDIGGGSTEFVVGKEGRVLFASSLNLGHVTLTQKCGDSEEEVSKMREYIRLVIRKSGLVEDIKRGGFEVAVGSSGTIQAVEKAVFRGYSNGSNVVDDLAVVSGEGKRDWRLKRGELRSVVERLCGGGGEEESVVRDRFFKRRSEFIVAGAVLLEEIFEALGIEEMEVSGFALSEGVIAEVLTTVYGDGDMNANTGWRSVLQLAMRFNGKKRMIAAAQCASIAKEIFEELRKCDEITDNQVAASLDDEDLEYLEAACMLHNIGLFTGKKGFHKQSYHIIMNGDHIYGYSTEEIKLIALLARHHRKKLPKLNHGSFKELPKEVKKKFKFLCAILRISVALCVNIQETESSHSYEGFKLTLATLLPLNESKNNTEDLRKELKHFKTVFHRDLSVLVSSRT